jgi:anti-anti-sigma factor
MDNKLDIRRDVSGTEQLIFLEGRLDANWAGHLDDYLNNLVREGSYRFKLNMSGVQYLSSAGIRILVNQYKNIKKLGGLFVLESLSPAVSEVLSMVGMINILTQVVSETLPVEK